MAVPKRIGARIEAGLKRFGAILENARSADRSEQDTVTIVTDVLNEVFGYDKYRELTAEYAIRGTYCDLAVVVDGKVEYLIEVKAIDKQLKAGHVRQATDYAAKEGVKWVVLTNSIDWQVYRMEFEQPVRFELSFSFSLLRRDKELIETIYTLSRDGVSKRTIESYHAQLQATNRYALAAVLLSERVVGTIRRELRRMSPNVRVDVGDIVDVLKTQVIKRDVIEGEEITAAIREVRKAQRPRRRSRSRKVTEPVSEAEETAKIDEGRQDQGDKHG